VHGFVSCNPQPFPPCGSRLSKPINTRKQASRVFSCRILKAVYRHCVQMVLLCLIICFMYHAFVSVDYCASWTVCKKLTKVGRENYLGYSKLKVVLILTHKLLFVILYVHASCFKLWCTQILIFLKAYMIVWLWT